MGVCALSSNILTRFRNPCVTQAVCIMYTCLSGFSGVFACLCLRLTVFTVFLSLCVCLSLYVCIAWRCGGPSMCLFDCFCVSIRVSVCLCFSISVFVYQFVYTCVSVQCAMCVLQAIHDDAPSLCVWCGASLVPQASHRQFMPPMTSTVTRTTSSRRNPAPILRSVLSFCFGFRNFTW